MALGRPREFDVDKAIDRAMTLFWRKGYEGTSLTDLTATLGITRPSLYAAFGNKEGLFRQVLNRYVETPSRYVADALKASSALEVAERLLYGAIKLNTNPRHPGCLMVQDAQACGNETEAVRRDVITKLLAGEQAIAERLRRAKKDGDLPPDANPAVLARYLRSVVYGIAVQAAAGATARELNQVAEIALSAWPRHPKARSGPSKRAR